MTDSYRQHFPRDDALIDSEMQRFSRIAAERGLNAANTEVISRLIASVLWLDEVYGTRKAYDLFQNVADHLLEYGRDARPVNAP
jgi:hypothetical protein